MLTIATNILSKKNQMNGLTVQFYAAVKGLVTHPKEELSSIIASFDPEGVLCAGEDVCGLNLKDIRWYGAL